MADSRSPTAPCQEGPSRPIFTFKVLDGELPVAAAEEGEESKHLEQDADHGTAIVPGSEPEDQRLVCRTGFWRRTAGDGRPFTMNGWARSASEAPPNRVA